MLDPLLFSGVERIEAQPGRRDRGRRVDADDLCRKPTTERDGARPTPTARERGSAVPEPANEVDPPGCDALGAPSSAYSSKQPYPGNDGTTTCNAGVSEPGGSASSSTMSTNSATPPGQPWVRTSRVASGRGERRCGTDHQMLSGHSYPWRDATVCRRTNSGRSRQSSGSGNGGSERAVTVNSSCASRVLSCRTISA